MSPADMPWGVFGTMCHDQDAPERTDKKPLRTFRTSTDQPYLVLPGEQESAEPAPDDAE